MGEIEEDLHFCWTRKHPQNLFICLSLILFLVVNFEFWIWLFRQSGKTWFHFGKRRPFRIKIYFIWTHQCLQPSCVMFKFLRTWWLHGKTWSNHFLKLDYVNVKSFWIAWIAWICPTSPPRVSKQRFRFKNNKFIEFIIW